ncbi:MAG: MarR family winged helix-turn-helix transcriptional regulator [Pseudomonadota bacterium]
MAGAKAKATSKSAKSEALIKTGYDEFDHYDWPYYWVTRANNAYLFELEKRLKSRGLDIPRWRVLMLLAGSRARSISYLAGEATIKLSTMTRMVQRMEDEGLVQTQPRATDQRVTEVLLTTRGEKARHTAWEQAVGLYEASFAGVAAEQIQEMNRTLSIILENLRTLED